MKKLIMAVALFGAGVALAVPAGKGQSKRLALSGGWVERAAEGKTIRIVNAQKTAGEGGVRSAMASLRDALLFSMECIPGEAGRSYRPDAKAGAVVTLVDRPEDGTTFIVAPEQAWAEINVAALAKDKPSAEVLDRRVHKEIWRSVAIILGASNSMNQPCVMRQINTLADLDATKMMSACPEPYNAMIMASKALGIGRVYRTTYKRACIEGWAPDPTNEIQKALKRDFWLKEPEKK